MISAERRLFHFFGVPKSLDSVLDSFPFPLCLLSSPFLELLFLGDGHCKGVCATSLLSRSRVFFPLFPRPRFPFPLRLSVFPLTTVKGWIPALALVFLRQLLGSSPTFVPLPHSHCAPPSAPPGCLRIRTSLCWIGPFPYAEKMSRESCSNVEPQPRHFLLR